MRARAVRVDTSILYQNALARAPGVLLSDTVLSVTKSDITEK